MIDSSLRYKIGLSLIPGLGPINAKKIIAYLGSIEAVFTEKKNLLTKIDGIGEILAAKIANSSVLDRADEEIEFIEKYNIKPFFYLDENYPYRLQQCEDAPLMFFMKGDVDLNQKKIISIVGTRKSTNYGVGLCDRLISEIKENGHEAIIVSGLAYGIDIAAHKAALKNNLQTVAVLGQGLDTVYPAMHRSYAHEIANSGALISEFLSGTNPDKHNFVRRNRIVAGLSDACIVIESALKGGSLISADIANSYNRDVFAFPGRISDPASAGCNYLIRTNKAALIESVKDLEYILGWNKKAYKSKAVQQQLFVKLNEQEQEIIELIKEYGELDFDHISMKTKLPINKLSALLLGLEFGGFIKALPGKLFTLA